jgi:hypothetical protein
MRLNRSNPYKLLLPIFFALFITACASNKPYENAAPGLVEVSHNKYFDRVLMVPGESLPAFSKVFIEEPGVTMNDYWLRNFRGDYTERDLERIKTSYAKLLKDSLSEGIAEHSRFTVVNSAAEAEVIFRPNLDSLNVYAPDLSFQGRIDQYIHEAGNATFNLQIVDSGSGKVLAQFVDHSETFSNPGMIRERTNRAMNARYFGRLMDRWSFNLMTYLTETNAFGSAE